MKKLWIFLVPLLCFACSKDRDLAKCESHSDCGRDEYCAEDGICAPGCATNQDCASGVCDLQTHKCVGEEGDQDGGMDGGGDQGGDPGGDPGGDQGGGDTGSDAGGDQGGGDSECEPTHDKQLGEACDCDDECHPDNPFCFADVMNDPGPLYCTIPNCTQGSCPTDYICNDFYTSADPPQPPFCQKCLGGAPRQMGEECLCDSDCAAGAPDCFKDIADDTAVPLCTITGCTLGRHDECPGRYECKVSIDFVGGGAVNFCKLCDPGDQSLTTGSACECTKDCVVGNECQAESLTSQDKFCVECLGGAPRDFGETCACHLDCNDTFNFCLVTSKYCSVLGCSGTSICPAGSTCAEYGSLSFCQKQ